MKNLSKEQGRKIGIGILIAIIAVIILVPVIRQVYLSHNVNLVYIAHHVKYGMSEAQVETELGKPAKVVKNTEKASSQWEADNNEEWMDDNIPQTYLDAIKVTKNVRPWKNYVFQKYLEYHFPKSGVVWLRLYFQEGQLKYFFFYTNLEQVREVQKKYGMSGLE